MKQRIKSIIITADDYGMCNGVDEAIISLVEQGMLTSTNVLVNFDYAERQVNYNTLIRYRNLISVGIHWNITTGKPVSNPKEIPTLVDSNGDFYPLSEFKKRMRKGFINPKHLDIELRQQYALFSSIFGKPDYWNTHENSVLCYKAYCVIEKVANEYGIRATRNFQRVYIDKDLISGFQLFRENLVKHYIDIWFGMIIKKKFVMPDARVICFKSDSKLNINTLLSGINRSGKNSIEIVIHPSIDTKCLYFGNIGDERVLEYNMFSSDIYKNAIRSSDQYRLVSFEVI